MKASEVIQQLKQRIAEHGDLPVEVEDGLNPSDPVEVSRVEIDQYYRDKKKVIRLS